MNIRKNLFSGNKIYKIGYDITQFSTATILLWIGIFKFTPTEAASIKPLIEYHPFTFWVYDVFSKQTVSNFIGIIEISLAIILLLSIKFHFLKRYAGLGIIFTFLITLSFLFFTPGMWRIKDGIPITDYFILKDLAYLGFGFILLSQAMTSDKKEKDTKIFSSY